MKHLKAFPIIAFVLAAVWFANAQAPQRQSYGPVSQGAVLAIPNAAGSQAASFEYLFSATPGAVSITIQGCMRGSNPNPGAVGTCDAAADTYAGTANSVRSPSFSKVYDTFLITVTTLTNATLTVNTTVVVSKAGTASGGSGSGTITANSGIAGANAYYPSAGGSTTISPTSGLSYDSVGNATLAQGTITVSTPAFSHTGTWNAGGVAFTNWISNITCTAAATASIAQGLGVAGTTWQYKFNGATCTNPQLLVPDGTSTNPSIAPSTGVGNGIFFQGASNNVIINAVNSFAVQTNGTNIARYTATGKLFGSGMGLCWSSNTNPFSAGADTCLSRPAAGVTSADTGTVGNGSGVMRAAAFRSSGTAAALTGTGACATFGAQTGGSTMGQSSCASATAASTLTITPGTTAPNGWVCYVQDETTRANLFQQTSHTTTACTLTATSVTQNDVFVFSAMQY